MPESATLEAPPQPHTSPIPDGLKATLDKVFGDKAPPVEEKKDETPPPEVKETPPAKKEEAPPVTKSRDIIRHLAPDFTTAEPTTTKGEAPPVEVAVDVDIPPEEPPAYLKTQKAKDDHIRWRKKMMEQDEELRTLRVKANAAPVEDTTSKTLLEQITKERDSAIEKVARFDWTQHPKNQQEYLIPRDQMFADAQTLIKESGGDPDTLRRAIGMSGKGRIQALEEISESITSQMMRGRFERLIEGIDEKTKVINEKMRNAQAENEANQQQDKIHRHEQLVKAEGDIRTMLAATRRDLLDEVKLEVLQKSGNKDFAWWDEQVDQIDQTAEEIMLKSTPEKSCVAAYLAASAGAYRSMFQAERAARVAAETELSEYKSASPKLGEERGEPKTRVPDDANMIDAVLGRLRK